MGWFLTGRSSGKGSRGRKKRGSSRSAGVGPKPWDPKRTLLALRLCAYAAVAVGAVVGWVYLEQSLTDYASARHAAPVTPDAVVLDDQPGWMSPAVEMDLVEAVGRHVGDDPLDAGSLRDAVRALRDQPWVRRVKQLRRAADGRVHVEAEYRQPVAVLRTDHGYVLVDHEGVRLPGLYERHQVPLLGLVEMTGVASGPPPVGGRWPGDDLAAGLALAQVLRDEPYAEQIDAIDVSGRDPRQRLDLAFYVGRRRIVWGAPIGHAPPIQVDAATKLDRLRKLAALPGGLAGDARTARLNAPGGIALDRPTLENAEARNGDYATQ